MAAYRADIEIGVVGAAKLKELQDRITRLSRAIDDANVKKFIDHNAIQSLAEYSGAAGKAAANLRETAIQLDAVGKASGDYANAISQLVTAVGQENSALEIQNNLIKEEIELRRRAKLAASGIRESTQYAGPIGPGPASPVGSLVGQTSPVEERIKRTIKAREDEVRLQEALLRLEEKSAIAANKELQARGEIARLTAQGVNAARFRAEQTVAPLALPAFKERGLQLLDDSVRLNESNLRIETALNGQRQRGVRYLEKQTAEEARQVQLGILGSRSNQLPGSGRATGVVPAGGFPSEGPLASPGFRGMQRNVGKFGENLALGAGFPLLFGGGPGTIAGSALGSFVGTGFGGQILGGAVGKVFDETLIKINKIGQAIKTLDFSALQEAGIKFTAELQTQLDILLQVGDALTAQKVISQEVARQTGTLPGVTEDVSNAVNILSDSWGKVTNSLSATVGIISAPFAVALAGILEVVNFIAKAFNTVVSYIGTGIKTAAEFVIKLVGGQAALDYINKGIDKLNSGLAEATQKATGLAITLNQSIVGSAIELTAAKQLTPGVSSEDKVKNIQIEKQKDLNLLFQEEIDARIKIKQENAKASAEIVASLLRQNDLLYRNKKELISINAERLVTAELQRRQEEAARAAKQAAEEAARAAEQALKARLTAERDVYEQLRKGIDLRVREAEFYEGPKAGLSKQQELLRKNYELQVESLDVERELAIAEAQKTGTTQKVFALYELKLAQLNSELTLETDILNRKIAQTRLSEQQAKIDRQRAQIATIRGVSQTNQRLQLETSIAPDSTQLREQLFLLDQSQRVYAELLPEQEKFRDLQREIRSGALDKEALISKQDELDKQQVLVQQLTEELSLRSELEKRQFKLNELYKQYGFIGNEVSAAISSSITGLITGTQTVAEAFSKMFENIGKAFIDMATQMLAQQLIFTVFRSILGAVPGGGGLEPNSPGGNAAFMDRVFSTPLAGAGYAEGGFVTGPTNALIGEGGQPEYVIPASKMRSAMGRYAAGARGASVIPSAGNDGGPNQPGGIATSPIDVRYTVERINSVDYVTADQFQAGMQQAAAQGAQRGEQRALRSLQQSTSVRSKVGLR